MKRRSLTKKLIIFVLILFVIGIVNQFVKNINYRDELGERESSYIKLINKQFPNLGSKKTTVNGLTVYLWREAWTNRTDHFKTAPGFPFSPDIQYISNDLRIRIHREAIGVRIFGYILPYRTGKYQFKIEANDAQTTEIWLSPDQNPNNMIQIEKDTSNSADELLIYETTKIALSNRKFYYIEIIHVTYKVTDNITIFWRVNKDYEVIEKEYLFQYPANRIGNLQELPSHYNPVQIKRITNPREEIPLLQPLPQEVVSDVFQICPTEIHQLKPQIISHFEGIEMVKEIEVFLSNLSINNSDLLLEGPAFNEEQAIAITELYLSGIQEKSGDLFKKFELLNLEKIESDVIGNHYLLEAKVSLNSKPLKTFLLSQKIEKSSNTFCLSTAVPDEIAFIHIVIIVHNQGRWLQHFIENINKIYEQTNDQLFDVIIVDFNSKDLDMGTVVKHSLKIKQFEYIYLQSGDFNKVMGQNIALERVTNPKDIIFNCDLHINLPINILDAIRKHTLQGYAVFFPMMKRLEGRGAFLDGYGWWDTLSYGLVSMYKTDWMVIGGMNREYGFKWGGEDLDLVDRLLTIGYHINRLRLPGLIHYHHPRDGKWYYHD